MNDPYGFRLHEAFGERKTLNAWARDPRCRITRTGLYYRVVVRGLSVEDALHRGAAVGGRVVAVRGQSKTLAQWAADPRCSVTAETIRLRLKAGWPPAAAVRKPRGAPPPPGFAPRPERKKSGRKRKTVTAWGEEKTLVEWAADPRAAATVGMIHDRLRLGWSPERAVAGRRYSRTSSA